MSIRDQSSSNLSPMFNELRLEGLFIDAILNVDGVEFPVHKVVLCSCSSYFRAYFTRWSDLNQTRFTMSGVSPDTMRWILDSIYTGSMPFTEDNIQEILIVADQFNFMGVVQAGCSFLAGMLHADNCIGIWQFTTVYIHSELRAKAFSYILEHFEEVVYSNEFLLLSEHEVIEILERDHLIVRSESIVFEAILRWIAHIPTTRENLFPALLQKVRLAMLDLDYIGTTVLANALVHKNNECMSVINAAIKIIRKKLGRRRPLIRTSNTLNRPRFPSAILLAIGGWSGSDPTNGIEAYNIRSDSWFNVTNTLERARAYHGTAFLNGYVYCVGGFDRVEYFNSVRRFDLATRTWLEVAPMNCHRCYVSVTVLNGCIYAMGGFNGHVRLSTAEYYRPETNQWSLIASMNERRSDASCTTFHNNIYICGGFNGQECLQTAEYYSPENNQWTRITSMNCRRSGVGVIAYEGRIYAVGGFDGFDRQRTAEAFNPRTNTWCDVASMNTPRSNFGIEVIEDRLFAVGGFNGFTTTLQVEYYNGSNNEWREARDMAIFRSALSCCTIAGIPNVAEYTLAHNHGAESEEEDMESSGSS